MMRGSSGTYNIKDVEVIRENSIGRVQHGIVCTVHFLDGTQDDFELDRQARGQELLDKVFGNLELIEKDYFGLQFADLVPEADNVRWLDAQKSIRRQLQCPPFILYFRVRFYVSDPSKLREEYTRYHFYLQLRKDIQEGRLGCSESSAALLGSYAVQSEFGDYCHEDHGDNYLDGFQFVPNQTSSLVRKIMELHKLHRSQTPADAEFNFLDHAKRLDMYGVDLYAGLDGNQTEVGIGVASYGIAVFQKSTRATTFIWSKITKISFKRKQFFVQLKNAQDDGETLVGFTMSSARSAKCLWKSSIEHHTFFRLVSPPLVEPRSFFTLGSQYRYSGRTEYQTLEEMKRKAKIERTFHRTSSKTSSLSSGSTLVPQHASTHNGAKTSARGYASNTVPDSSCHYPAGMVQMKMNGAVCGGGNISSSGSNFTNDPNAIPKTNGNNNSIVARREQFHYACETTFGANTTADSESIMTNSFELSPRQPQPPQQAHHHMAASTSAGSPMMNGPLSDARPRRTSHAEQQGASMHAYATTASGNRPSGHEASVAINSHVINRSSPFSSPRPMSSRYQAPPTSSQPQPPHAMVTVHKVVSPSSVCHPAPRAVPERFSRSNSLQTSSSNSSSTNGHSSRPAGPTVVNGMPGPDPQAPPPQYHNGNGNGQQSARIMSESVRSNGSYGSPVSTPVPASFTRSSIVERSSSITNGNSNGYSQHNGETAHKVPSNAHQTNGEETLVVIHMKPDIDGKFGFNIKGGADQNHPVIVSRVASGSPADTCLPKLNEGDQVLFINGYDISQCPHDQVVQLIRNARELPGELVLTVRPNVYEVGEEKEEPEFQYVPETPHVAESVPKMDKLQQSVLLLKDGLASGATIVQFEQHYRKKPGMAMDVAKLPENLNKNRYRDISPYDDTRVIVKSCANGGYINASFVNMEIPSSGIVNRYIAAQGPLPHTTSEFWQAIWEQSCPTIVMLTATTERGRVKCHKYWPTLGSSLELENLKLSCVGERDHCGCIFREFSVLSKKSQEERRISQIQYLAWPDHGVPDDAGQFIDFVKEVRNCRAGMLEPVLVHCSAGIGRTGVLILMETAMCLIEANEPVYPLDIVRSMRDQRAMLIQTSSQYKFVCEAIVKVYSEATVKPLSEYCKSDRMKHS